MANHEQGINFDAPASRFSTTVGRSVQPAAFVFEGLTKGLTDSMLGALTAGMVYDPSIVEEPDTKKGGGGH